MNEELSEIWAVVCFFEKFDGSELCLLYGPKLTGFGAGFMMPVGGKYKPEEFTNIAKRDTIKTGRRESKEESNLDGLSNMVVAQLVITILEKKQRLFVDIIVFTSWSGEIQWNGEFKWLKFLPLSEVFKSKLLPREEEWMKRVLVDGEPTLVEMVCGKDREDVLELRMSPLPKQ